METTQPKQFTDEVLAWKLVELYFDEIARLGFKRKLDFESVMNSYFYALQRLKNKDKELERTAAWLKEHEERKAAEEENELFPSMK